MGCKEFKREDIEFGDFIVYMREYLGLEVNEMAEVFGLTADIYVRLEEGKSTLVNKVMVEGLIRDMVKVRSRNIDKEYLLKHCCNKGRDIKEMHNKGLNVVQLSVELGIDEVYIEIYLIENGYRPLFFERVVEVPLEVMVDEVEDEGHEMGMVEVELDCGVAEEDLDIVYEYEEMWREKGKYNQA